jgi:hypothetical protein
MKKLKYLTFFIILMSGCGSTLKPGMIWTYTQPSVKYEKDPEANFSQYKNFSVFPQAELNKESKINPIEEKQLLFMARNLLELFGYNYVNDVKDADFLIAISYSNEYKTLYIPPSSYTIPWYVPGQTQTTFVNNYNTISGYIGSDYFRGSGSGWGTATTTTSGQYVPMTFTKPGGYVGWYYPCFIVSVIDKNTKKLVWSGSAVVATTNSDIRLSGQFLICELFGRKESNFPVNSDYYKKRDSKKDGVFGILAQPYTINGNDFYPYIVKVAVDSDAYKQGLRLGDVIMKIDEQSTLNRSFSQLSDMSRKNKGESLNLVIQRNEKIFDVSLIAEDREIAKTNWKEALILDKKWNIQRVKIPKQL